MNKHTASINSQPTGRDAQATDAAPPSSNTGVLSAFSLDWLAYTAPDGTLLSGVLPFAADWSAELPGKYAYGVGRTFGHCQVYYGGRPGMGIHVSLSGQALAELVGDGRIADGKALAAWVKAQGFNITRADFAIDDRRGLVGEEMIGTALTAGDITTRFRGWRKWMGGAIGHAATNGWTYYLGSSKSDAQLRIYDKAAERGQGDAGPWVRFEFQFRHDQANAITRTWIEHGEMALAELLGGYVRFRERASADQTKYRWPVAKWWAELLGTVQARQVHAQAVVHTLDAAKGWLRHQVAPMLATVVEASAGDMSFVYGLLQVGRVRMGPVHRALVDDGLRRRQLVASGLGS